MKTLKYYFKKAEKEHFAIGQFNFSDWSQVKGIVAAAQLLKSPIILGTSEGESKFVGLQEAVAMRNVLRKKTGLPIFLNLDHGKSYDYIKEAIVAGYDMVHFDGSKLPLEENIKISKKVVAAAKRKGIVVEGEVGRIGTDASRMYTEKFQIKEEDLTQAQEAITYLKKANVDVLAVSVGTFHGLDVSGVSPNLRLDRLREIRARVGIPLVLHGGSGTPEADIKEAIKLGIAKININTETRLAFSNTLRKKLQIDTAEIVPYKYLPEAIHAVEEVVGKYIKLFGSEGKM
ncbi:MAG TPA: class II fructose-bisphosphate aldolase [Negativicutes bacterium]|nr:class II fructose-bisphosphate aldolase [Negativicutes bacterium]